MNKMSKFYLVLLLGVFLAAITACGGEMDQTSSSSADEGNSSPDQKEQTETITSGPPEETEAKAESMNPLEPYSMVIHGGGVSEEEFFERFGEVIKDQFPHITVEYIQNATGTLMPDLVAQGTIPDIVRTDIPTLLTYYLDLGLGEDLTPYIEKYDYDVNRFQPVFIDEIIETGRSDALYGLPVPPYFPQVLYYNIDLFDQFGASYPENGMTWDEVYESARQLTRTADGHAFRGFSFNPGSSLRDNPFSLPILDPNADGLADMETWKTIIQNFTRFYEIPGNTIADSNSLESRAFGNGNVAMQLNQHSVYLVIPEEINWDIVSYPLMEGAPELMAQRGPAYFALTKQGEHKDEAFQVIMAMLSDEVQLQDSLYGRPATVVNDEVLSVLGQDHPIYSQKNMDAVNYYDPIPYTPKRAEGLPDVGGSVQLRHLYETFFEIVQEGTDINTALSELDEKLKQEVDIVRNQ